MLVTGIARVTMNGVVMRFVLVKGLECVCASGDVAGNGRLHGAKNQVNRKIIQKLLD